MKLSISKVFLSVCAIVAVGLLFLSTTNRDKLTGLISDINIVHRYVPYEKVYLHTNKPYYTLGENIWFKAYLTNGKNQLDTLNSIIYAELINEEKKIVSEIMLEVDSSTCKGDFFLPDTLSPGTYQIRAYTNYMRNFSTGSFFEKNIPVFSVGQKRYNWKISQVQHDSITGNNFVYRIEVLDKKYRPHANLPVNYKIKAKGLKNIEGGQQTAPDGSFVMTINKPEKKQVTNSRIELSIEGKALKWTFNLPLQKEAPNIGFFPEGGSFVGGMENRIAYKVTDSKDRGIEAGIRVFDQDSVLVANCTSNQLGMGAFNLTPGTGNTYFSYISYKDVTYGKYFLPKTQQNGYVLHIDNLNEDLIYLKAARNFDHDGLKPWSIILQSNGKVAYTVTGSPCEGELGTSIPKSELPEGICQVTLYDQDLIPRCERLVFIPYKEKPKVKLTTNRLPDQTYSFTVLLKDSAMKSANISLSMINRNIVDNIIPFQDNIFSYLELSSELRGRIENPGYYFMDDSLKRKVDLDYLLMTQGWRNFVWKEILDGKQQAFNYPIERAITVSGKICNYSNRAKKGEEVTMMLNTDDNTQLLKSNTDSLGKFIFYTNFNDTAKVLIQTKKRGKKVNRRLVLDKRMPPMANGFVPYEPKIGTYKSITKAQKSGQVRKQVERIFEFKTDQIIEEIIVSAAKPKNGWKHISKPKKVFILQDMEEEIANKRNYEYTSVLHFIEDNYSAARTQRSNLKEKLFVWGQPALVVLDGIPLVDEAGGDQILHGYKYYNILPNINWHSLEKIEVHYAGASIYAPNLIVYNEQGRKIPGSFLPVVCLYSNPDGTSRGIHNGIKKISLTGFYRAREFYHPIVSEDVHNNIIPEYRSTIYWEPELKCDSTGIFSFHLDRKDLPDNVEICIEGITDYGRPVYALFSNVK